MTSRQKRRITKKKAREAKNRRWKNLSKGGSPTRRQWKDEELRY